MPEVLKPILPENYTYLIQNFNDLPPCRTQENFEIPNFKLDMFVDVDSEEEAHKWFTEFQSWSKTTMTETKGFEIKGNRVIFRELRHCIHSSQVKKKQGHRIIKRPRSSQDPSTKY